MAKRNRSTRKTPTSSRPTRRRSGASRPVALDLALAPERPLVRIAGTEYEMRHPTEVSLKEYVRIQRQAEGIEQMFKDRGDEGVTEDEADKLAALLDELARYVLPEAPEALHKRLTDTARMSILRAFTHTQLEHLSTVAGTRAGAGEEPDAATGG